MPLPYVKNVSISLNIILNELECPQLLMNVFLQGVWVWVLWLSLK